MLLSVVDWLLVMRFNRLLRLSDLTGPPAPLVGWLLLLLLLLEEPAWKGLEDI